jgi:hypothetical protein
LRTILSNVTLGKHPEIGRTNSFKNVTTVF